MPSRLAIEKSLPKLKSKCLIELKLIVKIYVAVFVFVGLSVTVIVVGTVTVNIPPGTTSPVIILPAKETDVSVLTVSNLVFIAFSNSVSILPFTLPTEFISVTLYSNGLPVTVEKFLPSMLAIEKSLPKLKSKCLIELNAIVKI